MSFSITIYFASLKIFQVFLLKITHTVRASQSLFICTPEIILSLLTKITRSVWPFICEHKIIQSFFHLKLAWADQIETPKSKI